MTKLIKYSLLLCVIIFFVAFGKTGVRGGGGTSSLKLALFAIGGVLFFGLLLYLTDKIKGAFTETNRSSDEQKKDFLKNPEESTKTKKTGTIPSAKLKDVEKIFNPNAPFDNTDKILFLYKEKDNLHAIYSGRIFLLTEICDLDIYIPYLKFHNITYSKNGRNLYFDFTFKASKDVSLPFIKVDCKIHLEKQTEEMRQTITIKECSSTKKELLVSHLKKELNHLSRQPKMEVLEDKIRLTVS